jgi:hypothetical protein
VIAGLAALVVLGACGTASEEPTVKGLEARRQTAITYTALAGAAEAAQRYGQAHLGHFLKLRVKGLKAEGLELQDAVSLAISTEHASYCIRASNEDLASIHPWATATVSSRNRVPSIADRCHP